jgi:hypothetical protein
MAAAAAAWIDCPIEGCQNVVRIPISVVLDVPTVTGATATASADMGAMWEHLRVIHQIERDVDADG